MKYFMERPPGPVTRINGREVIYFGGTSYYGLHGHPEVIDAAEKAMAQLGTGPATTGNGYGYTTVARSLEERAQKFFGSEAAFVLGSGFLSALASLRALSLMFEVKSIILDEFCHYSIRMAAESSGIRILTFRHCNPEDLKGQVRTLGGSATPLVATDGVFAGDGTIAPLTDYIDIIASCDGLLWVDDAHASGILGNAGKGSIEYHNIQYHKYFTGTTLSKAFGGFGGLVHGAQEFVKAVKRDPYTWGASPPPTPAQAAAEKGMDLLRAHPEWTVKLRENAKVLKTALRNMGFKTSPDEVPIAAFSVGSETNMLQIKDELFNQGIAIQHIHYPGTPGEGVLRMVVTSGHTGEHLEKLIYLLNKLI